MVFPGPRSAGCAFTRLQAGFPAGSDLQPAGRKLLRDWFSQCAAGAARSQGSLGGVPGTAQRWLRISLSCLVKNYSCRNSQLRKREVVRTHGPPSSCGWADSPFYLARPHSLAGFESPSRTPFKTEIGGERGIRTPDRVSPIHAFQACAFSLSAISPLFIR